MNFRSKRRLQTPDQVIAEIDRLEDEELAARRKGDHRAAERCAAERAAAGRRLAELQTLPLL